MDSGPVRSGWTGLVLIVLKLTKKADYGLIALRHLALGLPRESASTKEIADAYGIPLPLLAKVLQKLARSGLLVAVHGANGGYKLARDPRMISALEVIRAMDGPIILTSCFSADRACGQSGRCSVREPLRRVHERMLHLLESISVFELTEDRPDPDPLRALNTV